MSTEKISRETLRRALESLEADTARLQAAVPGLMIEAGRRRRQAAAGPSLVALAWRAVPRFAAAAVVLLAIAAALGVWERASADDGGNGAALEAAIAGGAGYDDALADAMLPQENR